MRNSFLLLPGASSRPDKRLEAIGNGRRAQLAANSDSSFALVAAFDPRVAIFDCRTVFQMFLKGPKRTFQRQRHPCRP
jgi:hypothetical protein